MSKELRALVADSFDRCAHDLSGVLSIWYNCDAPSDTVSGDEWPFAASLEDQIANFQAAAARIREADESFEATITIDLTVQGSWTPEKDDALHALADVMLVQAEDGLYPGGYRDAPECDGAANPRLADFLGTAHVKVEAVTS